MGILSFIHPYYIIRTSHSSILPRSSASLNHPRLLYYRIFSFVRFCITVLTIRSSIIAMLSMPFLTHFAFLLALFADSFLVFYSSPRGLQRVRSCSLAHRTGSTTKTGTELVLLTATVLHRETEKKTQRERKSKRKTVGRAQEIREKKTCRRKFIDREDESDTDTQRCSNAETEMETGKKKR